MVIDGVMEVDETNESAKHLLMKDCVVSNAHPELTENLGATAIQGHAVPNGDDN